MGNESFSAQEWIDYFLDKIERGIDYTVDQVRDVVKMISVKDPVAARDAVTVFYSSEGSEFPLKLSETAGGEIRMIDRTEACKFLAHDRFGELFKKVVELEFSEEMKIPNGFSNLQKRFLYDGSSGSVAEGTWEASEGFWSIVSRRFASETSGDAYALVSNALPDRIFATDELKTLLETLPDGAKICGFDAARGVVFDGVMRFGVSARFVCTGCCAVCRRVLPGVLCLCRLVYCFLTGKKFFCALREGVADSGV